jgi:hypothetical protein
MAREIIIAPSAKAPPAAVADGDEYGEPGGPWEPSEVTVPAVTDGQYELGADFPRRPALAHFHADPLALGVRVLAARAPLVRVVLIGHDFLQVV